MLSVFAIPDPVVIEVYVHPTLLIPIGAIVLYTLFRALLG